jgi:hypothetical protein
MNLSSTLQNVIKLLEMTRGVWHAKATKDPWHSKTPVFAGNVPLGQYWIQEAAGARGVREDSPPNLNLLVRIKFFKIILYIYLNKNWNIYWSKQSFTVLELEDQCSSWRLMVITWFPDFSEVLLYIFVTSTTTRSS